ncbi:MAG: C39 family peptidase [Bacteroidales bacterium]|nr:C39 family peptidase [Bacteroidales bacterium]
MKRVVVILIGVMVSLQAWCYRGGTIYRNRETGELCAAVKTKWFVDAAATQQNQNWCWAACVQMVLAYQGVAISQDEIVTSVFGWPADKGGTAYDIVNAVNSSGRGLRAKAESPSGKSKLSFIDDLAKRYPLIVGLYVPGQSTGHAWVMTGIVFTTNADGTMVYPRRVILRNPWPYRSGQSQADREELDWAEFISRVHTIVHVYPF